ncbi:MAG TPA: redox-regulated ATPase YchF [Candidatus Dormibacteraeota bacterium]|nr:redox-regulated ATPase YchF [Candidatus Dormibacteraeota bacterium]
MKIGIVGLPNVGKSTLFNALTKASVLAANYPFATIEPNVGIVPVPDSRLQELSKLYDGAKVVPAAVTFVDIAGLVKGASKGQGLGNKFLGNIRECQAICQVVRAFHDTNVTHVEGKVDPADDIEIIETELILADLQAIENHLPKAQADVKKDKSSQKKLDALLEAKRILDAGQTLHEAKFESEPVRDLHLLTAKPFIYVFNIDEADLDNNELRGKLSAINKPVQNIFLCAKVEAELIDMEASESAELLKSLGQKEPGLNGLAKAGYRALGLQTFLTAGPKEVRAWTVRKGATAPEAAGVIHTDFQKGFIKAEVVTYEDLISAGSQAAARAAGKVRLEGKDYVMREGDVVEFRFNV